MTPSDRFTRRRSRQWDNLAAIRHLSRAELIREAFNLADNRAASNKHAFGLWADGNTDGIHYDIQIRKERE
jgi:hypothetical protein